MKRTPFLRGQSLGSAGQLKRTKFKRKKNIPVKALPRKLDEKSKMHIAWAKWQLKCWMQFSMIHFSPEKMATCMVPGCKEFSGLQADHVMPRSNFRSDNWHPTNGAVLCRNHNSEKGSSHGPKWDYRTDEYKVFQKELADKEWEKDHMNHWVRKENA